MPAPQPGLVNDIKNGVWEDRAVSAMHSVPIHQSSETTRYKWESSEQESSTRMSILNKHAVAEQKKQQHVKNAQDYIMKNTLPICIELSVAVGPCSHCP